MTKVVRETPNETNIDTASHSEAPKPTSRRGLSRLRDLSWGDRAGLVTGAAMLAGTGYIAKTTVLDNINSPEITSYVERQIPYPEAQTINEQQVSAKYGINIATQKEAFAKFGMPEQADPNAPKTWTQEQLHLLDQNLADLPPKMYGEINNNKLTISLGVIDNLKSHNCTGICNALFISRQGADGGLIILGPKAYNVKHGSYPLEMLAHELTHRKDYQTKHSTRAKIQRILDDMSYMNLPEFTKPDNLKLDGSSRFAIGVLKSYAGGDSNPTNKHQIFIEGVAETSKLYTKGYIEFMRALGPGIDWTSDNGQVQSYAYYSKNMPVTNAGLKQAFPKTDALYRLFQDEFFDGYGYDGKGNMINGKDAANQALPTPIVVEDEIIGTISDGKITSIVRPTPK